MSSRQAGVRRSRFRRPPASTAENSSEDQCLGRVIGFQDRAPAARGRPERFLFATRVAARSGMDPPACSPSVRGVGAAPARARTVRRPFGFDGCRQLPPPLRATLDDRNGAISEWDCWEVPLKMPFWSSTAWNRGMCLLEATSNAPRRPSARAMASSPSRIAWGLSGGDDLMSTEERMSSAHLSRAGQVGTPSHPGPPSQGAPTPMRRAASRGRQTSRRALVRPARGAPSAP